MIASLKSQACVLLYLDSACGRSIEPIRGVTNQWSFDIIADLFVDAFLSL